MNIKRGQINENIQQNKLNIQKIFEAKTAEDQ